MYLIDISILRRIVSKGALAAIHLSDTIIISGGQLQ